MKESHSYQSFVTTKIDLTSMEPKIVPEDPEALLAMTIN